MPSARALAQCRYNGPVRRSLAPLLVLAGQTFLVGLGGPAITDADEAFYAEAAREMVESGDWLTPHYDYEPRFQKPVLYYWATAATFLVFLRRLVQGAGRKLFVIVDNLRVHRAKRVTA